MKKEKIVDALRKLGVLRFGSYKNKVKSGKDLPGMAVTDTFSEKEIMFNLDEKKKKKK
jgi:hypothetical protein